jgi:hypothetical protein
MQEQKNAESNSVLIPDEEPRVFALHRYVGCKIKEIQKLIVIH